jgi:hypothetical protein
LVDPVSLLARKHMPCTVVFFRPSSSAIDLVVIRVWYRITMHAERNPRDMSTPCPIVIGPSVMRDEVLYKIDKQMSCFEVVRRSDVGPLER